MLVANPAPLSDLPKVIRLVDSIFKREGLNLRLRPYAIMGCGEMKGLVECITDAKSIDHIKKATVKSGGIRVGTMQHIVQRVSLPSSTTYRATCVVIFKYL